jgi:predicted DNA binding CopG/RHH family protein
MLTVKGSKSIGVRLELGDIEVIKQRAARRGWSFNKWINWAVDNGLRKHTKPSPERTESTR